MSDDQFTKLFKYMQQIERDMHDGFARVDQNFDRVYGLLDTHIKQMETLGQEQLVIGHQLTRHEKWIDQLARKTDSQLEY